MKATEPASTAATLSIATPRSVERDEEVALVSVAAAAVAAEALGMIMRALTTTDPEAMVSLIGGGGGLGIQ